MFEIVTTTAGAVSIRNNVVNEIMHNPIGPWREANDLYVIQSKLTEKLQLHDTLPLVLFDVGLGAASNALAAIHARINIKSSSARKLHIISFENNLDLLRFALDHAKEFSHMHGFETAMEILLEHKRWESSCGSILWDLTPGDFLEHIDHETHKPELVFFDPYSPAVNQDMWTLQCFEKLKSKCYGNLDDRSTTIYTYSVATPVRVAMLLAGFYVGYGQPTGLKKETTQFSTHLKEIHKPLDESWFGRWVRSHTKFPYGSKEQDFPMLQTKLEQHPQVSPFVALAGELLKKAFPGRKWE